MSVELSLKGTVSSSSDGPLKGTTVLDMGIYRSAPHCSLILARLGADVIKVEPLGGEEARKDGVKWAVENNSKRSLAINLRDPRGQSVIRQLAKKADILVQNFRPGVMAKMNLAIDDLLAECPRLIVVSISAYGADNPLAQRPGYDGIMQAAAGIMFINGVEGTPPLKVKSAIVDRTAGLHAAIGAIAALHQRGVTGRGQSMDISLCQSAYSIVDLEIAEALTTGKEPKRTGNRASNPPVNNAFEAKDGWLYLATGGRQRMWEALCQMIGKPEWLMDERFRLKDDRSRNADLIEDALATFFRAMTVEEAVNTCVAHHLPAERAKTALEAANSKYVEERDVIRLIDTPYGRAPVFGDPWHFSQAGVSVGRLPTVGEHTRAVLGDLGAFSTQEIDELTRAEVVR